MFERQATLSLFPTLVWVFDLPTREQAAINAGILRWLARSTRHNERGRPDLTRQTDHDFHLKPEFYHLHAFVTEAAKGVLAELELKADQPEITGCWINVGAKGSRHHEHSHPNNYLSGVYYLATPAGAGSITFYDPRPQAHVLSVPTRRFTPQTASSMTVGVQPGRLVLFHSWLRHAVEANQAEEDRVSLSFNLMFSGFTERFSRPMWRPKIGTAPPDRA
jgi:uncharacterized protein (TIGR02466 family)